MATTTLQPGDAPANPDAPSLILAMHARYEEAWEEYNRVDRDKPKLSDDATKHFLAGQGMAENFRETLSLQRAILHQLPTTDEEATVLAHHAWVIFDEHSEISDDDKEALATSLTTLFDWFVAEGRAEAQMKGKQFSANAMLACHRRRARTGELED